VLVVANQTVGGKALLTELRERCQGRDSEILVVVPALTASALEHWSSDVDEAIADAQRRLDASLGTMREAGLRAAGQVGDHHDPDGSIEDALREFAADEVVISTHPPDRSRWLESGVVETARENLPLPVTHVIVDLEAEAAAQPS
jgi:GABA permease